MTTAYSVEILEDDGFWAECGIRRNRSDALQMADVIAERHGHNATIRIKTLVENGQTEIVWKPDGTNRQ